MNYAMNLNHALAEIHICTDPHAARTIKGMGYFAEQLNKLLDPQRGQTKYRLAKDSGVAESTVINIANGKVRPSDSNLEKFAQVGWLNVPLEKLQGWRMIDEYGPEVVLRTAKEAFPEDYKEAKRRAEE